MRGTPKANNNIRKYYNNNKYNNNNRHRNYTMHTFKPRHLPLGFFVWKKKKRGKSRLALDFDVVVEERRGVGSDGDGFVEFAEIGENAVEGRSAFSEDDALVLRGSREELVEGSRLREEDEINGDSPLTYQANFRAQGAS